MSASDGDNAAPSLPDALTDMHGFEYALEFFPTAFFNVPKFWPSRQSGMVICSMPGSGGG